MRFGFFTDLDTTRFCYLRLRRLKEAMKNPQIVDGVMRELSVPSAGSTLSMRKKIAAIDLHIDRLRADKTSVWYGAAPGEVLAAGIFNLRKLDDGAAGKLFSDVASKDELAAPMRLWLSNVMGFTEYKDAPAALPKVDVLTHQVGRLMTKPRIMGIELHNDLTQLEPALERMTVVAPFTHAMYLACTPAFAAEFLLASGNAPDAKRWDPTAFRRKLADRGFGLFLIEGDAVSESLAPRERQLDVKTVMEFINAGKVKGPAGGG
ncbi:MAG TPA: hypothetical protein VLA14_06705 [Polyangia bacterium]|jgi:hypothetical protein|nr:hypothetical protein [Polyangia bacterium]